MSQGWNRLFGVDKLFKTAMIFKGLSKLCIELLKGQLINVLPSVNSRYCMTSVHTGLYQY